MEKVLKINGYELRYSIDESGVIKSLPLYVKCRGGKHRLIPEKKLSIFTTSHGYKAVDLTDGRSKKRQYLHRLIYEHFVAPIPDGMVINHIDGNPSNNSIENLECVTQQDNVRHYFSGVKNKVGVHYDKSHRGKKWRAQISNGGSVDLGYYRTEEEANSAVQDYINTNLNHLKYR